jgi:hypothetical protein
MFAQLRRLCVAYTRSCLSRGQVDSIQLGNVIECSKRSGQELLISNSRSHHDSSLQDTEEGYDWPRVRCCMREN